jgi:hypothetical protein
MQAVNKVPEAQRDRLAALMGGVRDRFIGGSADTMYIPGRHRAKFMSTLALFLQTNCFLEIAAPTTLHLTLPPDEEILFVDHVRSQVGRVPQKPSFSFSNFGVYLFIYFCSTCKKKNVFFFFDPF